MSWINPVKHRYDRPPNPSQCSAFFIFAQDWRDRFLYFPKTVSTRSNQQPIQHITANAIPYLIQPYCYGADNRAEVSESFLARWVARRNKKPESDFSYCS